jgi:hypothetical protein
MEKKLHKAFFICSMIGFASGIIFTLIVIKILTQ